MDDVVPAQRLPAPERAFTWLVEHDGSCDLEWSLH